MVLSWAGAAYGACRSMESWRGWLGVFTGLPDRLPCPTLRVVINRCPPVVVSWS